MTDDIVERLRAVLHNDRSVELMNREAANEIERLRKELDTCIAICNMRLERIIELAGLIDSSLDDIPSLQASIDSMGDEIIMLARERDEARREILESLHPDLRDSYVAARGWDCFKENTNDR